MLFAKTIKPNIQNVMKIAGFFISISIVFSSFSQQFEMLGEQYPFYSVLEWKGMGAILLNHDPSGNTKKENLTLVGSKTTSIWQQSFNPNSKDFHFISSENARYVYFLDNLLPFEGKIALHQLNSAGNIKSTSVSLSPAIKKLGAFDLTEMELVDIITTDKALVHIFRHHDTKEKKFTEIATFVTHHNLLVYATILGEISEISLKEGIYGQWKYVGFTDDQIYFAAKDNQNKNKGWSVKNFTSKGALTAGTFITAPKDNFDLIQHVGVGANGKTILHNSSETESGTLIHHASKFYLTGVQTEGTAKTAKLKLLKEGEWVDLNSSKFTMEPSKKPLQFGNYPLYEGIGCKVGTYMIFLPYDPAKKAIQNNFTDKLNTNPSRFIIEEKKELFAVSLIEGNLFFDSSQLNKSGNVKFEFIKK